MKFTRTDHEIVRPFYKYIGKDAQGESVYQYQASYHRVFLSRDGHCYISNDPLETVIMRGDRQNNVRRPLVRRITPEAYQKAVPMKKVEKWRGLTYTPIPYLIEEGRLVSLEIFVPRKNMMIDRDERYNDHLSEKELFPDIKKIESYIKQNFPDIETDDVDKITTVISQYGNSVYSKTNIEFGLMNYDRLKERIKYLPEEKIYSYDFADKLANHQKKIGKLKGSDCHLSDATINQYHPIIIFFVVLNLAQGYEPNNDVGYNLYTLWCVLNVLTKRLELPGPTYLEAYKVLESTVLVALDSYISRGETIEEETMSDDKILPKNFRL